MKALTLALALALGLAPPASAQPCPPEGWSRDRLASLRDQRFAFDTPAAAERWAAGIVACLASPDPALRDGIAYEGLARLLRGESLGADSRRALAQALLQQLDQPDAAGFGAPFAALVLAEVVRADGSQRFLAPASLQAMARRAAAWLTAVRDHRGFDDREGWRHAVAHGADWLAQLARHPGIDDPALWSLLRDAVAAQVAPAGHAYIHGEPERLMVPVVVLAQRGAFTAGEWQSWFEQLASPAPLAQWGEAFGSSAGLARRHNLRAFLLAVLVEARLNTQAGDDSLLPAAEAALRRMR